MYLYIFNVMHCRSKVQSTGTTALRDRKENSTWRGSIGENWRDGFYHRVESWLQPCGLLEDGVRWVFWGQ